MFLMFSSRHVKWGYKWLHPLTWHHWQSIQGYMFLCFHHLCLSLAMKRKCSDFITDDSQNSEHHLDLSSFQLPDGPTTFESLFDWPADFRFRICNLLGEDSVITQLKAVPKIALTTHFSGVGTAEIAAKLMSDHLYESNIWPAKHIVFYSACDYEHICQKVLKSHPDDCKALHLFSDVCEPVPQDVIDSLRQYLSKMREEFHSTSFSTPSEQAQAKAVREKAVHVFAQNLFSNTQIARTATCLECGKQCSHHPNVDGEVPLWIDCSGTPCPPFVRGGAYGHGMGFLHDATVPFYCWIYGLKCKTRIVASQLRKGPDAIIHENVPGFPIEVLDQILNANLEPNDPGYTVQSLVWSALDEGIPVRRERRYTLCIKNDLLPLLVPFNLEVWRTLSFAECVSRGTIFFKATSDMMAQLKEECAARRGLPPHRVRSNGCQGEWSWEVLLTASERNVLLAVRKSALEAIRERRALQLKTHSEQDTTTEHHVWLVNLSQSLGFQPKNPNQQLQVMPALLRSSKYMIEYENNNKSRMLHPLELFGMQTLPVFLSTDHRAMQSVNFEHILFKAGIALHQMRLLSGNGMNASCIGKTIFFVIATLIPVQPRKWRECMQNLREKDNCTCRNSVGTGRHMFLLHRSLWWLLGMQFHAAERMLYTA